MTHFFYWFSWILMPIIVFIDVLVWRREHRRRCEAEEQARAAEHLCEQFMCGALGPRDWFDDVLRFHLKFNAPIQHKPGNVTEEVYKLRKALIAEEVNAELFPSMQSGDMVEIADAIADSIYVLLGTAIAYGIDIRPVWKAVHKANMTKMPYDPVLAAAMLAEGKKVPIGKIMKPKDWREPDIAGVLHRQTSIGISIVGLWRDGIMKYNDYEFDAVSAYTTNPVLQTSEGPITIPLPHPEDSGKVIPPISG